MSVGRDTRVVHRVYYSKAKASPHDACGASKYNKTGLELSVAIMYQRMVDGSKKIQGSV